MQGLYGDCEVIKLFLKNLTYYGNLKPIHKVHIFYNVYLPIYKNKFRVSSECVDMYLGTVAICLLRLWL